MSDKKKEQLGMPPGTAANRLKKSLLWKYVCQAGDNICFQCGKPIESEDELTIEHKIPWLDSEDPIGLFFDLENISFSHFSCNVAARRRELKPCGTLAAYSRGCRCDKCRKAQADRDAQRPYCANKRRQKYKIRDIRY